MLAAGCAPALDWREVRAEDGPVVALMPCKPKALRREVSLAGAGVTLTLQACDAAHRTWALASAEVADPARVGPVLFALRRAALANLGVAAPRVEQRFVVAGATPHPASTSIEFEGRLPSGELVSERVGVFAHGTRVYQATVFGPAVDDEGVRTFFGSLHVAGR
jgi:hypothetical protein